MPKPLGSVAAGQRMWKTNPNPAPQAARAGFTLLELTIVIALISIAGALVTPVGVAFWRSEIVDEASGELVSALRSAERGAHFGKGGNGLGVKILEDSFTVFLGESYDTREEAADLVIPRSESVVVSGIDEIVFAPFSGVPSVSGTITLEATGAEKIITIHEYGLIE